MIRIHTASREALVVRCMGEGLCEPVCPAFGSLVPEEAVALLIDCSEPKPTSRVRLGNHFVPKALRKLGISKSQAQAPGLRG